MAEDDDKGLEATIDLTDKKGKSGDEFQYEIVDDTPSDDRGRPQRQPGTKSAIPEDDELGQYTQGVQNRIKQMKWEYHEERRAKEAAQREQAAAVEMTKQTYEENKRLRKLLEDGHKTMLESNKSAAESELGALRESLRSALESGETGKASELQEKIARAAARAVTIEQTQPLKFDPEEATQQQNTQQAQAPQVRITKPMQEWMDENPWFNRDRRMTSYAFGIHDEWMEKHGKGQLESPAYFKAINDEMKRVFPEYFGSSQQQNNGRVVASASRSYSGENNEQRSRPSKVTLTQSEVAVAKRLGITPEQYAREKARMMEQS